MLLVVYTRRFVKDLLDIRRYKSTFDFCALYERFWMRFTGAHTALLAQILVPKLCDVISMLAKTKTRPAQRQGKDIFSYCYSSVEYKFVFADSEI